MVKTKKQLDLLTMLVLSEDAQERAELADKLRKMLSKEEAPKVTIASVLRELGAPTNVLGYNYLIRAIEMQMQSNVPLDFTKGCYMGIASAIAMNDVFGYGKVVQERIELRATERTEEYNKKGLDWLLGEMEKLGFLVVDGEVRAFLDDDNRAVTPARAKREGYHGA